MEQNKANNQIIAHALQRVRKVADDNNAEIVQSHQITRADREVLTATDWLQEITRGWYMLVRPDVASGDSAAWYANFWDFLRLYLAHAHDTQYCLSAEASLDLHTEQPCQPQQVVVMATTGGGAPITLPYHTSLLTYQDPTNLPQEPEVLHGLQVMSLPLALCRASPSYFKHNPQDAQIALGMVQTPGDLSRLIALDR